MWWDGTNFVTQCFDWMAMESVFCHFSQNMQSPISSSSTCWRTVNRLPPSSSLVWHGIEWAKHKFIDRQRTTASTRKKLAEAATAGSCLHWLTAFNLTNIKSSIIKKHNIKQPNNMGPGVFPSHQQAPDTTFVGVLWCVSFSTPHWPSTTLCALKICCHHSVCGLMWAQHDSHWELPNRPIHTST